MAKDAILNVRSGDVVLENSGDNVRYYDVKWGKLFDYDVDFFMNIIVPYYDVNKMTFEGNEQVVMVHAPYHPVCMNFIVRLIALGGDGVYYSIRQFRPTMPMQFAAYWKPSVSSDAKELCASELPIINIDGYYLVHLISYNDSNFNMAMIYSAYQTDIKVGEADSQSAQLLSLCGPGKYYRFPMNGVDITRYINSVVAETDLGQRLQTEFEADSKVISDATFDSGTGDLSLVFDGDNVEDGGNLTPVDDLDLEVLQIADDKYIDSIVNQLTEGVQPDKVVLFFGELSDIFGVYTFDGAKKVRLEGTVANSVIFDADGKVESRGDYMIVKAAVRANSFIQFNLPDDYDSPIIFTLSTGQRIIYKDYPYAKDGRWFTDEYKMSAIVLKSCTISYAIPRSAYANSYGVYVAEQDLESVKDFLVVTLNKVTSRLTGYVSKNSEIKAIRLNQQTGQIWAMRVEE